MNKIIGVDLSTQKDKTVETMMIYNRAKQKYEPLEVWLQRAKDQMIKHDYSVEDEMQIITRLLGLNNPYLGEFRRRLEEE